MEPDKTVHFVLTGGTIDSYYEGTKDTVIPSQKSVIPQFMKSLKLYGGVDFTEVCMKDSRDMTPNDMQNVTDVVEHSFHTRIIVTHGTYTMPDTARFLQANLSRKDQVIIITGSMIPMEGFTMSDGPFNIGFAIAKFDELTPGIYLCMNGRIFSADEAIKVSPEGRFRSIFGEK